MKKRYLQYGEKQIHIRELEPSGNENGNPILCLHPSPYSGLFFETIMPMINKNRKIIAPDYLGYGSSSSLKAHPQSMTMLPQSVKFLIRLEIMSSMI